MSILAGVHAQEKSKEAFGKIENIATTEAK